MSSTDFLTPSAFIFLYENNLFLTFRNRTVAVWNFKGELVTSFEDHLLWHPDCSTNNIYITSEQDLIISYCKADEPSPSLSDEPPGDATVGSINTGNILTGDSTVGSSTGNILTGDATVGSINMSNILTGKCIAKISANDPELRICPGRRGENGHSSIRSTVREALEDVTALFYDEDRNEIYTGNKYGLVHVWSN